MQIARYAFDRIYTIRHSIDISRYVRPNTDEIRAIQLNTGVNGFMEGMTDNIGLTIFYVTHVSPNDPVADTETQL